MIRVVENRVRVVISTTMVVQRAGPGRSPGAAAYWI
jgi:hypothetical protein